LKSFKLRDDKNCRLLAFDPLLERGINSKQLLNEKLYDPSQFDYDVLIKPEATNLNEEKSEEKEIVAQPDNSTQ
jgi:hypothetical protein